MDSTIYRKKLVEHLKEKGYLHSKGVEEAFLSVKREDFVRGFWEKDEQGEWHVTNIKSSDNSATILEKIYVDKSIPTLVEKGEIVSSSSQPAVMSIMAEEAGIKKGSSVLEIGTGSGYNAAILQQVVGGKGKVVTVEVNETVYNLAKAALKRAGIYKKVKIINTDGLLGYKPYAPYDSIIVTTSIADITFDWIEQLKKGGKIVAPAVTFGSEVLISLTKVSDKILEGKPLFFVEFTRVRGIDPRRHFTFYENEFLPLKEIITKYSVSDKTMTRRFEKITPVQRYNFFFFLSLHSPYAFSIYINDRRIFGLLKEAKGAQGCVAYYNNEVKRWGEGSVYADFREFFDKWKEKGMPGLSDYDIVVVKKGKNGQASIDKDYTLNIFNIR